MSKVTINPVEDRSFKPFDLVIRVESEEELAILLATFNTSTCSIKEQAKNADNNGELRCFELVEKYVSKLGHGIIYQIYSALSDKFRLR